MKTPVELYVNELLRESYRKNVLPDHYVTIRGKKIKFGCKDCVEDISFRITDAIRIRNCYPGRSDGRVYYSGILRILRRELKAAQKILNNLPI
jgi:hypothetical protein